FQRDLDPPLQLFAAMQERRTVLQCQMAGTRFLVAQRNHTVGKCPDERMSVTDADTPAEHLFLRPAVPACEGGQHALKQPRVVTHELPCLEVPISAQWRKAQAYVCRPPALKGRN